MLFLSSNLATVLCIMLFEHAYRRGAVPAGVHQAECYRAKTTQTCVSRRSMNAETLFCGAVVDAHRSRCEYLTAAAREKSNGPAAGALQSDRECACASNTGARLCCVFINSPGNPWWFCLSVVGVSPAVITTTVAVSPEECQRYPHSEYDKIVNIFALPRELSSNAPALTIWCMQISSRSLEHHMPCAGGPNGREPSELQNCESISIHLMSIHDMQ